MLARQIFQALQIAGVETDTNSASGVLPFGKIAFGVMVLGSDKELVDALAKTLEPVGATKQEVPHKLSDTEAAADLFVAAKPPR